MKVEKNLSKNKFTLISKIGVLYNLYWDCQIAYVGGGFSKGIHNIMEPSIAGIPIIFGPKYEHANEAYLLLKSKGAFCISNGLEFETAVLKLLMMINFFKSRAIILQNW